MTGLESLLIAATVLLALGGAVMAAFAWRWRRFIHQQNQRLQRLRAELQASQASLQRERLLHNRQLVSDKQLAQLVRLHARMQADLNTIKRQLGQAPAPTGNPVIEAIVARIQGAADDQEHPTATLDAAIKLFQNGEYAAAHTALLPFAETGDPIAQSLVARLYYAGHGVAQDEARYWYWLERAAEGGDRSAKAKLKQRARSAKGTIIASG